MDRNPTSGTREPPQEEAHDEHPPIAQSVSSRPKKSGKSNEGSNRTSKKHWQEQLPNWIMALASIVLVVVTAFYTQSAREQVRLTEQALEVTKDSLFESTEQFAATLLEMKEQTVAAQTASDAAEKAAAAANKSAEIAGRQVAAMEEQTNVTMDAMRLDQRAWVGYSGYVLQARKDRTSAWTNREPKAGEQFRVRFLIQNTGKTPAFNVRVMDIVPKLVGIGETPAEPMAWFGTTRSSVHFPHDDGISHNTGVIRLTDQQFSEYSKCGFRELWPVNSGNFGRSAAAGAEGVGEGDRLVSGSGAGSADSEAVWAARG